MISNLSIYAATGLSKLFNYAKEIYVSAKETNCYYLWSITPTYNCIEGKGQGIPIKDIAEGVALLAIGSYLIYKAYASYKEYKKRLELLERK